MVLVFFDFEDRPRERTVLEFLQKNVGNFKLLVSYVSCDCKKDWNKLFAVSFLLVQISVGFSACRLLGAKRNVYLPMHVNRLFFWTQTRSMSAPSGIPMRIQ